MKTRLGFVSNSSSSSFVIRLDNITEKQLADIQEFADSPQTEEYYGEWYVTVDRDAGIIFGHNSDSHGSEMYDYMKKDLKIDMKKVFTEGG